MKSRKPFPKIEMAVVKAIAPIGSQKAFKEKVEKYLEYKKTDYINENKIPSFDKYNMNISKEEIDKINSYILA